MVKQAVLALAALFMLSGCAAKASDRDALAVATVCQGQCSFLQYFPGINVSGPLPPTIERNHSPQLPLAQLPGISLVTGSSQPKLGDIHKAQVLVLAQDWSGDKTFHDSWASGHASGEALSALGPFKNILTSAFSGGRPGTALEMIYSSTSLHLSGPTELVIIYAQLLAG